MHSISDTLSVICSIGSIATLWRLLRTWPSFWDNTVTAEDDTLASMLAFFILIPLGVLLHELGHAIATWQRGGQVVEFQWRIFWGYIIPQGNFSPSDHWWISLSGNLVSVAIGLLVIPLILLVNKLILKKLLYTFSKLQIIYSLIFYPLWSLVNTYGDWLTIYNFSIKPHAQITLVIHLGLLIVLWKLDKSEQVKYWRAQPSSGELD